MSGAQNAPSDPIIPHGPNVTDDSGKTISNNIWRVFQEQDWASYFIGNSRHFSPQTGFRAVDPVGFAGRNARLCTGETSFKHVDTAPAVGVVSGPWFAVECPDVVPYPEPVAQRSVRLSCEQNAPGMGINFASRNGTMSEQDGSQDAAAGAGEQFD